MAPQIVLITGASGGIGAEVARRVVARGDCPVLVARTQAPLAEAARECGAPYYVADLLDAGAFHEVCRTIAEEVGEPDALVHAVGSVFLRPLHVTSLDDWRATFETNATSAFIAMKTVLPGMMRRKRGNIVLFSTVATSMSLPNHETVAAAKSAVNALVRTAAISYARYNIRVNAVAPALTRTPLSRGLWESEAMLRASTAMHPLGRIGEPGDVAAAVLYFLSPDAGWTTGQILGVDGGLGVGQPPPRINV